MLYTNRKGAAAVLALIFVAVFGLLSVAFHTMTVAAISTAANDKAAATAQGAAESGLEYTGFLLSRPVNKFVSTSAPTTDSEIAKLFASLDAEIDCSYSVAVLRIPATGTISFTSRPSEKGNFFATVEAVTDTLGKLKLNVTVTGSNGSTNKITRNISASCDPADTLSAIISPLDFGVAARGTISFKNGVTVTANDAAATMMSASVEDITIKRTAGKAVNIGTVWVTNNVSQGEDAVTTTVKVLPKVPVVFDDYEHIASKSTCEADSTFECFATWEDYKRDRSPTKTKVYIDGPWRITMGEETFDDSLVFGPKVTSIVINGSKQHPTKINFDPKFKYALIAPKAYITYGGNTWAHVNGYVVADRFGNSPNNSSGLIINNGGLLTLSKEYTCDLGQSDFDITLPAKADRPNSDTKLTSRRYVMNYSGYQED